MRILREGMQGPDVRRWQKLLAAQGHLRGRVDGVFGPLTRAATIAFQTAHQLTPDGVVGPRTLAAAGLLAAPPPPPPVPVPSTGGVRVTPELLRRVMPRVDPVRAARLAPSLQRAMAEFRIHTPARAAAFLAQLAHESGQLRFMEEIWGPTSAQRRYEPFTSLARMLGNTQPGDGKRFKGRGPIQLTGRANYQRFGQALGVDLIANPALAATPELGFRVAGLYWKMRGLNLLADQQKFRQITRRINGGFNGLVDRLQFYERAKRILGVSPGPVLDRVPPSPDDADVDPNAWRRWTRGLDAPGETTPTAAERSARRATGPARRRTGGAVRRPVKKAARTRSKSAAKTPTRTKKTTVRKRPATPARKTPARKAAARAKAVRTKARGTAKSPARKRPPSRRR